MNNQGKNVFDDNNQKKSWPCLRQSCSKSLIGLLSQFLVNFDYLWLLLEIPPCKNLWRTKCLKGNSVYCTTIRFTFPRTSKNIISTKFCVFSPLVCPVETRRSKFNYNWLKSGTFQTKFDKLCFLISTPSHYKMLCGKRLKILSLFEV